MLSRLFQNLGRRLQGLLGKSVPTSPMLSENNTYSEIATFTRLELENMLRLADMPCQVKIYQDTDKRISLELENTADTGLIIGKNGQTLEAFQILLKAFIQRKFGERRHVIIDANKYRKRNEEKLSKKGNYPHKAQRVRRMKAQDSRTVPNVFASDPQAAPSPEKN